MPYPTGTELIAFCNELGITPPSATTADRIIAEAIGWWERGTGYTPFEAAGSASARTFDPPGPGRRIVQIGALTGGFGTIAQDGVTVPSTEYTLGPTGKDYCDFIEFKRELGANPITITARWGRVAAIPADVTLAILRYGAMGAARQTLQRAQGITGYQEGSVRVQFGNASEADSWSGSCQETLARYRRMWVA